MSLDEKRDALRSSGATSSWHFPSGVTLVPSVNPAAAALSGLESGSGCVDRVAYSFDPLSGRYQPIPQDQRPLPEDISYLEGSLFGRSWAMHGMVSPKILFNAGAANNGSQTVGPLLVLAVDADSGGAYADLSGELPVASAQSISRVNPEWPFPDPVTGQSGRLVFEATTSIFPANGSQLEFAHPSALADGPGWLIKRYQFESDGRPGPRRSGTFRAYLHAFPAAAREPFDRAFPPTDGKYWATIRAETLAPPDTADATPFHEAVWVRDSAGFVLAGSGGVTVTVSGRVWPEGTSAPGVAGPSASYWDEAGNSSTATCTVATSGNRPHVSYLSVAAPSGSSGQVSYSREWRSGDSAGSPGLGQCTRCRLDPSDSLSHEQAGERSAGNFWWCQGADFADGVADGRFARRCWLPGTCSGFTLSQEPDSQAMSPERLSSLWHRSWWIVKQQAPGQGGPRGFQLERVGGGGPSVLALGGSYRDGVPGGVFQRIEELRPPTMGRLNVYAGTAGQTIEVVPGAITSRTRSDGTPPDANDNAPPGWLHGVPGYTSGKPLAKSYPHSGTGSTNVYGFGSDGHDRRQTPRFWSGSMRGPA